MPVGMDLSIGVLGVVNWVFCPCDFSTQLVPSNALSRIGVVLLIIVGGTYATDFLFPTELLPPGAPPATVVATIDAVDGALFRLGSLQLAPFFSHLV
jgi:hypothetical protein